IDYPEFEILFGVRTRSDTALPWIERLQRERPDLLLRIIDCTTVSPNGKVGSLIDLAREARHPVLLVNDSDIVVEPDYLRNIVAPLENPETGLVTCLYRASGSSFPAKMEALGIATDFAPSTLVAPVVGVNEFGLGSTLCFRASDLQRIGGFENIAPYIADDYQLGKRISQSGLKVHLSTIPVETHLGGGSWRDVWHHQVRWARTVRVSKGAGYSGLLITNATFWAVAAALAGLGGWAIGLIFLRLATGLLCGAGILRDPLTRRLWWLMPVRDLFGVAVWAAGLFGRTVIWRGKNMKLTSEGRLEEEVN
ncbi:MAG TPA: glycosyltransferase, partial [Bryobacteraceae bacterium]|nr:glycosyltransferase [Bryobacteraceae bacterium]